GIWKDGHFGSATCRPTAAEDWMPESPKASSIGWRTDGCASSSIINGSPGPNEEPTRLRKSGAVLALEVSMARRQPAGARGPRPVGSLARRQLTEPLHRFLHRLRPGKEIHSSSALDD